MLHRTAWSNGGTQRIQTQLVVEAERLKKELVGPSDAIGEYQWLRTLGGGTAFAEEKREAFSLKSKWKKKKAHALNSSRKSPKRNGGKSRSG